MKEDVYVPVGQSRNDQAKKPVRSETAEVGEARKGSLVREARKQVTYLDRP